MRSAVLALCALTCACNKPVARNPLSSAVAEDEGWKGASVIQEIREDFLNRNADPGPWHGKPCSAYFELTQVEVTDKGTYSGPVFNGATQIKAVLTIVPNLTLNADAIWVTECIGTVPSIPSWPAQTAQKVELIYLISKWDSGWKVQTRL